jgi:uncharacterized protein YyaL (SSP411 family)
MLAARILVPLIAATTLLSILPGGAADAPKNSRLLTSSSPFLLRHASDPVDWFPWGPEAFEKARSEKKPLFVSVGYDSCHWCYRMQSEAFTDPVMAAVLNRNFVNVLVDRVQRPDLNGLYMTYLNANRGSGGWPLNVWITPSGVPFSVGTYFPSVSSTDGPPTFAKVVEHVSSQWSRFPDYIEDQSKRDFAKLAERIESTDKPEAETAASPTTRDLATSAYESLSATFDPVAGGFTSPTKFVQGTSLQFLAQLASEEAEGTFRHRQLTKMLSLTATAMIRGGLFDHVGGGFHRYSIDPSWQIPRFEKMLPAQSEIIFALLDVQAVAPDPIYAETIRRTLDFANRELLLPSGLFQTSVHSDSKSSAQAATLTEGAYYIWSYDDFAAAVGDEDLPALAEIFQVRRGGNLNPGASENEGLTRVNILRRRIDESGLAAQLGLNEADLAATIDRGLGKLAEARARRPQPDLDTNTVTGWNATMASAFARSYQTLGNPADLETARKCIEALLASRLGQASGQLATTDGGGIVAYSYAATISALLDLYDATLEPRYVEAAVSLQTKQIECFWDSEGGGFFETLADDPDMLVRLKNIASDLESNTNDISARNLRRLADLLDDPDLLEHCSAIQRLAVPRIKRLSGQSPELISNAIVLEHEPIQILLEANPDSEFFRQSLQILGSRPGARYTVFSSAPQGENANFLRQRNARLGEAISTAGTAPSIRVGRAYRFEAPLATPEDLKKALSAF